MSDEPTFAGYIEAPRWAGFPAFMRNECWLRGLKLEMEVEKGWLRESVRYRVKGNADDLSKLVGDIRDAIKRYNKD